MALEQPSSDSVSGLREELLAAVGQALPVVLANRLRFAAPAEVAALILLHLQRDELSTASFRGLLAKQPPAPGQIPAWREEQAQRLAASVLDAPWVLDCESAAEAIHAQTNPKRREAIRQEFQERTASKLRALLEVQLEMNGLSEVDTTTLDRLCAQVQAQWFDPALFHRTASSYCPAKGKTFERYLLWKGLRLTQTCTSKFARERPPQTLSLDQGFCASDDDAAAGRSLGEILQDTGAPSPAEVVLGQEESESRALSANQGVAAFLGWLHERRISPRTQAVWFLFLKAYAEPEVIPERLTTLVAGGRRRLREEYRQVLLDLDQSRAEFLEAAAEVEKFRSDFNRLERTLRSRYGVEPAELAGLEVLARKSGLGELEEELDTADPVREDRWACEVRCMMAWKRAEAARKAYEKACDSLKRYQNHQKPWVRKLKEIAGLLREPAGTIGRELAEAKRLVDEYVRGFRHPDSEARWPLFLESFDEKEADE